MPSLTPRWRQITKCRGNGIISKTGSTADAVHSIRISEKSTMGKVEEVRPYNRHGEKEEQVEEMFDTIAPAYDFMNNAMSFGLHRYWRNTALKKALSLLPAKAGLNILDVATGTGDLVFHVHSELEDAKITGIDLSSGMLRIARQKLEKLPANEREKIAFGKADCLALPYHDGEFDMVTVAYGVRNFSNLLDGLKEMRRVLKSGGVVCVIELSCPENTLTKRAYKLYSGKIIPALGKIISGDNRATPIFLRA